MKLIDDLQVEHERIERVLGSMRTYFDLLLRNEATPADASRFLDFFQIYAGEFHHEREEQILFPALEEADLPGDRGPILVLNEDHDMMEGVLAAMRTIVERGEFSRDEREKLNELARRYSHDLWHHIDAENHVFFPESEIRLRRNGVAELDSRDPDDRERAAATIGDELSKRYARMDDRDVVRGDGCMMCPAYGTRCDGIEREWWNQWEWEELSGHIGSD